MVFLKIFCLNVAELQMKKLFVLLLISNVNPPLLPNNFSKDNNNYKNKWERKEEVRSRVSGEDISYV